MKTNCGSSPESITQALDLHNVTNRTFSADDVKVLLEKQKQLCANEFIHAEMTHTIHSICDNVPTQKEIEALEFLCKNCLDKIRERFGVVRVSSGYRSQEVNRLVGGASTSQHTKGEAADIILKNMNKDMFNWIAENVPYDQLIWEYGNEKAPSWIHISYKRTGNRKQILRKQHGKGYEPFKPPRI